MLPLDLRELSRQQSGREASPSAAILDSQTVKAGEGGPEDTLGYDASKKIKGRWRHLLVGTQRLLLTVSVQAGNVQDRERAKEALGDSLGTFPRLKTGWGDTAYSGALVTWTACTCGWTLEIVRPAKEQAESGHKAESGQKGFAVQPHRWVVERTFAWLSKYRRLIKDYEFLLASSEAMIRLTLCHLMLRRLKAEVKKT